MLKLVDICFNRNGKDILKNINLHLKAGIDLWSFGNLISVFNTMRKNKEGSILVISHQERILNIAEEILLLDNGVITSVQDKKVFVESLYKEGKNGNDSH